MKVRDRIVDYLYKIAPDEAMPKTISRVLKIPHGTVKKELTRILAATDSPLMCEHRGFYRHKFDLDILTKFDTTKQIELHGIQLQGVCHQANGGYSISKAAKSRYRKRGTYKELFEDRIVTITVFENGLVQAWLNTSEHPVNFHQFDRFQAWLKGLLDFVAPGSWILKQVGLNVDVRQLQLDGLKSMKLMTFRNAWFQIYQKGEDTVRFETHLVPNIKLDEAWKIMRELVQLEPKTGPPAEYAASETDQDDLMYG